MTLFFSDGYFAAFGAGTFLYLSLTHIIPEVLDQTHHHHHGHHTVEGQHPIAVPEVNATPAGECDCCEGGCDIEKTQLGKKKQNEGNTFVIQNPAIKAFAPVEMESSKSSKELVEKSSSYLSETFQTKLRGFFGVGLGFAFFALVEIYPTRR